MKNRLKTVLPIFINTMFIVGVFNLANLIIARFTQDFTALVIINSVIIVIMALLIKVDKE